MPLLFRTAVLFVLSFVPLSEGFTSRRTEVWGVDEYGMAAYLFSSAEAELVYLLLAVIEPAALLIHYELLNVCGHGKLWAIPNLRLPYR